MAKTDTEMLSATKWAEKLEVPASQFKKALKELGIEPDMKKSGCAYYSKETAEKVKKAVN